MFLFDALFYLIGLALIALIAGPTALGIYGAAFVGVCNRAYWTLAYLRLVALPTDPSPAAGRDGQTND